MLKAIADPTRLRLLSLVAAHEGGEGVRVRSYRSDRASQPTVSHHLKILVDAGLLTRDKRGVWAYYAIVPGALDALADLLRTRGPSLSTVTRRLAPLITSVAMLVAGLAYVVLWIDHPR